jgi:hypothetical protein
MMTTLLGKPLLPLWKIFYFMSDLFPRALEPYHLLIVQRERAEGNQVLELLHTHLGFIFPKIIPCLLVIISHYLVSYILRENIPPREYSLSVDTSV